MPLTHEEMRKTFAGMITKILQRRKMTTASLAKELRVTKSLLYRWKIGDLVPTTSFWNALNSLHDSLERLDLTEREKNLLAQPKQSHSVGHLISSVLSLLQWKEAGLARQLHVSQTTVSRWKNGLLTPGPQHLEALNALYRDALESMHRRIVLELGKKSAYKIVAFRFSKPLRYSILERGAEDESINLEGKVDSSVPLLGIQIRSAPLPKGQLVVLLADKMAKAGDYIILVNKALSLKQQQKAVAQELASLLNYRFSARKMSQDELNSQAQGS